MRNEGPQFPILDVWSNWISETARVHFDHADPANGGNQIRASFKRWMVFNEPFLRGLLPHNAVRLFQSAKSAIRGWDWYRRPVFIGGVSGAPGPDYGPGYTNRPPNPMSPLERHFALMAYGAAPDPVTGENVNEALAFHQYGRGAPESPFLHHSFNGLRNRAALFSLGRSFGMVPVRVILDEGSVMPKNPENLSQPYDTQASYVARALLLLLSPPALWTASTWPTRSSAKWTARSRVARGSDTIRKRAC